MEPAGSKAVCQLLGRGESLLSSLGSLVAEISMPFAQMLLFFYNGK